MAAKKPTTTTEPIESYRARALVDIQIVPGFVVPAGNTFETDHVPFDPKTMERIN